MGRFINADAFTTTGQGLLGNNMFAYCNNNPIIYIDPEGACTKTGYKPWLSVTLEYIDCKSVYCPTSKRYIESDFLRKSLETIDAIFYNAEIDAGIGLGMFISGSIYDVIGLDFGINYDLIHFSYSQGKVHFMQTYFSGSEGTFLIMAKFDVHSDSGSRALPFSKDFGPWQEDVEKNVWTMRGASGYAAIGGQISVGMDVGSLMDDLLRIFGRK